MGRLLVHPEILSGTTSSGSFSLNTSNVLHGVIKQILIKPASGTTTYNITITNNFGHTMYKRTSETGELSELVDIPVNSMCLVAISSATADELFTFQFNLLEYS